MSVSTRPQSHITSLSAVAWTALALLLGVVVCSVAIATFTHRDRPLIVCDKAGLCQFQEAAR